MPEQPYTAPSVPSISPEAIIAKFMAWYHVEGWKVWIFLGVCIVVAIIAVYYIYEHYMKSPLKMRKLHFGKFKLSNFIKLKKR